MRLVVQICFGKKNINPILEIFLQINLNKKGSPLFSNKNRTLERNNKLIFKYKKKKNKKKQKSWKEIFKENYEFKWIPKTNLFQTENNGKTLITRLDSRYVSCQERKKVLVNGLKTKRTKNGNNEKEEYKWKIRIDKFGYLGVGFAQSDYQYNWEREVSLNNKSVIVCNNLFYFIYFHCFYFFNYFNFFSFFFLSQTTME